MASLFTIAVMAPAYDLHLHYWTLVYVLGIAVVARVSGRLPPRGRQPLTTSF